MLSRRTPDLADVNGVEKLIDVPKDACGTVIGDISDFIGPLSNAATEQGGLTFGSEVP